jgi:hypothetical protein
VDVGTLSNQGADAPMKPKPNTSGLDSVTLTDDSLESVMPWKTKKFGSAQLLRIYTDKSMD